MENIQTTRSNLLALNWEISRLKYFLFSLGILLPLIIIQSYLQVQYYSNVDYMIMNLDALDSWLTYQKIIWVFCALSFLFLSHLRLSYLGKKKIFIFLFFIPFINLLFFIYLLVSTKR